MRLRASWLRREGCTENPAITALDIPFIIVSGVITDEVATLAMEAGASDYVKKDNLARLGPIIARELRQVETRRSRSMVAAAVKEAETSLHAVIEAISDPAIVVSESNRLQFANDSYCRAVGRSAEDSIGLRVDEVIDARSLDRWSETSRLVLEGRRQRVTNLLLTVQSGQAVCVRGELIPARDKYGLPAILALLKVSDVGKGLVGAASASPDHELAQDESREPRQSTTGAVPYALIVAGRLEVGKYLSITFENAGYRVASTDEFEITVELARQEPPDVVMIDSSFIGAASLCTVIKRMNARTAIIVLGQAGGRREEIEAHGAGVDDYIEESAQPDEILSRAGIAIRRTVSPLPGPQSGRTYSDAELQIDFVRRAVVVRGKPVQLTVTEFSILEELVRYAGEPIAASDLVKRLWGPEYETEDIVRWHLSRLRRKIERDPDHPRLVTTRRGFGYQYTIPSHG